MARVSLVEKENAQPMVKELYEKNEARGEGVLNLFKVLGHCPYIGLNFQRLGNSILRGEELSPKLKELAILRVGSLARCEYEFTKHSVIALRASVSQKQVDEIGNWESSKEFNKEERDVLAYTDEVALKVSATDRTFSQLRSFLSEHSIVELTVVIGFYGMVCRVLVALQVELE
jgi:alkylhydroperoxidase family enzyme